MMLLLILESPEVCDIEFLVSSLSLTRYTEYWLSVENSTITPDGYTRSAMTFNGTVPGPAITADWGDNLIIRRSPVTQRASLSSQLEALKYHCF